MLVLTGIFNLHVKVMRDAENAKFGLKVQGKTNSLKDIEVMVFLLTQSIIELHGQISIYNC
jgi:hypothetical protein